MHIFQTGAPESSVPGENWQNLNGMWEFTVDYQKSGRAPG